MAHKRNQESSLKKEFTQMKIEEANNQSHNQQVLQKEIHQKEEFPEKPEPHNQ